MTLLGKKVSGPILNIEAIELPSIRDQGIAGIREVSFHVKEFTSVCPVTGQPDYYDIAIEIEPRFTTIESKSLKLWLWHYRNKGIFCEDLAQEILHEVMKVTNAFRCAVTITQASRGGIEIQVVAVDPLPEHLRK